MMAGKRFTLVYTLFIIHVASCNPVDDLIKELEVKITAAADKIDVVVTEAGKALGDAQTSIVDYVDESHLVLTEKLDELRDAVKNAEEKANQTGKNIQHCIDEGNEAIGHFNDGTLQKCTINQEMNKFLFSVVLLDHLKPPLINCPDRCVNESENLDMLRKCILDSVFVATRLTEQVESRIDEVTTKGKAEGKKCADNATSDLMRVIEKIRKDFDECINDVE